MSTSRPQSPGEQPTSAIVWIWLPGEVDPVPAGRVDQIGTSLAFQYGERYLERDNRIAIYEPELPLRSGQQFPAAGIHGCLLDAGPDSWGQRVILHRRVQSGVRDTEDLRPLTYLMAAGSDRIGALDFQASASDYEPRESHNASLDELAEASQRVQDGMPLSPELAEALLRGSSIGGARPKALIDDGERRLIAKFSSANDSKFPLVQGEFVAMRLAQLAGLNVAPVEFAEAMGKPVLLVERFDRPQDGSRRLMVSALTVLGLNEESGRYASYADFANVMRSRFTSPDATLRELFSRITFNILTSNTDDHARNQAAFWDGAMLTLTPAYDICPYPRSGETEQVMAIGQDGWRYSQVAGCVARAGIYHLSTSEAQEIVDNQIAVIRDNWKEVCEEARLTQVQQASLWEKQFLNPFALQDSHTNVVRDGNA